MNYRTMIRIVILFILVTNAGIHSKEKIMIPERVYDDEIYYGKNYGKSYFKLRKYFKVNLTNSGDNEYIAFYYECKKSYNQHLYDLVRVYRMKGNRVKRIYRIEHVCFFDYRNNELEMKTIKDLEKYFGPWNGYFYIYDLNRNGVPELFLYDLAGIGGSFGIYEYSKEKDKFETILPGGKLYDYAKMIIDKDRKAFIIYEHYEPKGNYPAYVLHYAEVEYKWDDKKKLYVSKVLRDGLTYEDVQRITNKSK